MKFSIAVLTLIPAALAHFQLNYPTAIGVFNEDTEGTGPCGGQTVPSPLVSNANSTNVTVDSFAVALRTGHPQSQWLYRATISTSEPYNWTNLLPLVSQTSQGQFCLPNLKAPANFAGKPGIVQVIGSATDGYLYQCAIVNFVAGSNTTVGSACTNATGLTATITTANNFTSANASSTTGSGAAATSTRANTAGIVQSSGLLGAVFAVIGAVFML